MCLSHIWYFLRSDLKYDDFIDVMKTLFKLKVGDDHSKCEKKVFDVGQQNPDVS
jgi:hypothetical protein